MKNASVKNENRTKDDVRRIPILNIRMMTDEEWNRLAYENAMRRKAGMAV